MRSPRSRLVSLARRLLELGREGVALGGDVQEGRGEHGRDAVEFIASVGGAAFVGEPVVRVRVTPEWRRKLQLLTEHAGDPIAAELAEARKEAERLRKLLGNACNLAARLANLECDSNAEDEVARLRREGGIES